MHLPISAPPRRTDLDASSAPQVAAVGTALPPNRYGQAELLAALQRHWRERHHNPDRLERMHRSVTVEQRCLALTIEEHERLRGFGDANDAFIRVGTEVGACAVRGALDEAGLEPADLDAIFFTTVTGLATPTIDARLVNALGLRPDVRRTPMFGLGCVGGAAGVARMADYLRAYPDHAAVLLSVELCSLTLQEQDLSIPNLIASGLFGDGAAAVVGLGGARVARRSSPSAGAARVLASRSVFYPDTERVMGWDIDERGFKVVLSAEVPELVEAKIGGDVDAFLAEHGLARSDVRRWVCHPGGPKVIAAVEAALGLAPEALDLTRRSLVEVGNLSSASVLFVLADTLQTARPGDLGLLMAMGPGFCSELVLLKW